MKMVDLIFRAWYYFRIGYSTYLAFMVAFMSYITVIYKLAIEDLALSWIFPRFYTFIIFSVVTIVPVGVLIGWFHFKRTLAYSAAMAINVESNPYNYMIMPGKETEIIWPMHTLYLTALQKILEKENILSQEEKRAFEDILTKIERLREGQIVGTPRHRQLLAKLKKG